MIYYSLYGGAGWDFKIISHAEKAIRINFTAPDELSSGFSLFANVPFVGRLK